MGLFLSSSELEELTGYKIASKQNHWLRCHGYYLECNARGIPRITHTQVEEMRRHFVPVNIQNQNLSNQIKNPKLSAVSEPDFSRLRQKIKKEKHE